MAYSAGARPRAAAAHWASLRRMAYCPAGLSGGALGQTITGVSKMRVQPAILAIALSLPAFLWPPKPARAADASTVPALSEVLPPAPLSAH